MLCPILKDHCAEQTCALWASYNQQCAILTIADCLESTIEKEGAEVKVRVVSND